jgi:hypothetical protein
MFDARTTAQLRDPGKRIDAVNFFCECTWGAAVMGAKEGDDSFRVPETGNIDSGGHDTHHEPRR